MCNCIYNKLATHIVTVSLIAFMTDGFHKNMHAVHKASVAGALGTRLLQATGCGQLSVVKTLLNVGCPVGVVDSKGWNTLHYAADHGSVDVIRELLSKECDIYAIDSSGMTPLHVAAVLGETKVYSTGVDQTRSR